jgi:nucleoside-diphosphate-sugar epimerase
MNRDVIMADARGVFARVGLDRLGDARVIITGASGLIGTYFLASLAALNEAGGRVDVVAQVFGEPPAHLIPLIDLSRATVLRVNLGDFREYPQLPEADVIVHGAGYAQPLRFMANAGATLQIGTAATLALLQRVRPGGHLLFLSSSQVYTGLNASVCDESMVGTTTPAHPRSSYIEGKRAGEAACHAFRASGVHATAARLGDVYGPGTRPHDKRALNGFIEQALTSGEIRMLDAGAAVRTYAYVADAVDRLWRVLLTGRDTIYNVGGRQLTTIAGVAEIIGRLTGVTVTPGPAGTGVAGAPDALKLDLTRVNTEFGVPDEVPLEEGLAATIAWQRQLYQS